jgi:hypothetical protein
MYRLLGHYVESACNGDMNTFVSSGFVAQTKSPRAPEQPVAVPALFVDPGSGTGQLVATLKAVPRARMYKIRFAPVLAAGAIITWTMIEVATAKPGVPTNNLMPGTIYTFQARAFGKLGFSDRRMPTLVGYVQPLTAKGKNGEPGVRFPATDTQIGEMLCLSHSQRIARATQCCHECLVYLVRDTRGRKRELFRVLLWRAGIANLPDRPRLCPKH